MTAGYGLALLGAFGAVWVNQRFTPADASQGMAAFGDSLLFLGTLAFLSIAPTALMLWYLRACQRCWDLAAALAIVVALTGPLALGLRLFIQLQGHREGFWLLGDLLAMLRTFGAPILALGFGVCSWLSPTLRGRYGFLLAAGLEALVTLYVAVRLILFQRLV